MTDNQYIILGGGTKVRYASVIPALRSRINSVFLSLSLTYFIHQYLSLIPCLIKDLGKRVFVAIGEEDVRQKNKKPLSKK